ncbi:PREDICTED: E3 ubiquitin-protein ligase SPL1-like isoform X1 [Camelina sativa]|uniref:RING-type E3 ubiquitin transferase n=1 Tax=Camelina sativa TaxID=90675 RepID=A0ABM1RRX0_CAMSA|nr:PREDICTED: E3 ubiquitin-protein ligase SPL1-like isoform X1 [Camelina sativa]XP_010512708.1 PREDICTED: E3 ubiquitin-protein ligase SPL1-like isoform X1 [Camelina sativa]XP_010512709.1 PREDICTED: E3 ubiquitin-protein ligase SPL1-like isoform X1 [Camelina sativa]XP_010512710.1 PREDICTED: E3 ubiquitin-protein ligase SPL1-like isoform X1 [Camelina sativa]XP_010512711.1 PREDICTED: E3 ubiquitin-protein ligase SPL1-like isoform X1 [Camelina sativa]XP_019101758.1 PREDICTED: E3 ubiquitin-protein lig
MIEFYLGGLICLSGTALYILSKLTDSDFEMLNPATRVHQIKDLEQLLALESKIVSVSGIVGSQTPIKCELSDTLSVFVKKTAQQVFLKRNWWFSWVQDSNWMVPITKEVPWYLEDGTGRVNVAEANKIMSIALRVGSEVFEESKPSSDCLKGLKMLGVKHTEHVLPIGTWVTVVGEAVKDSMGVFTIQKPEKGPFFVSRVPLDKITSSLVMWSRRFKYASIGLTVVGVILISKPVIQYILERRRERLLRIRVADAAAAKRAELVTRELGTQHENNSDSSTSRDGDVPDLCVICLEHKNDAAFVKCGHVCCCLTCSSHVKACPLCRRPIEQVLKIYRL